MCLWSIGEMIQAPRYYELISDLAPKGQQALFQGYAFLPIAIAWAIGGTFGRLAVCGLRHGAGERVAGLAHSLLHRRCRDGPHVDLQRRRRPPRTQDIGRVLSPKGGSSRGDA